MTKVTNNGEAVKAAKNQAVVKALRNAGYAILADASNLVPHDTGELENTGDIKVDENNHTVTVFFDAPHAIRQHEDTTLRHPNGRQAKYLEQPLRERGGELADYISTEVNRELS
jgi:hypothetical protein